MYETIRGLILREVRYKESDRILTVLTDKEGKCTMKARGALRKSSKSAAATQMLTFSELTVFENKGRRTVSEGVILEGFPGLREDIASLALGTYFAEVLETVSEEGLPDPLVLQLALNSLYALSNKLCDPVQIKACFELRLMCLIGYEPEVAGCAVCGEAEVESPWLFLREGRLFCGKCRQPGALPLKPDTLAAMRHIVWSEPKRLFSFTLGKEALSELGALTERYLIEQLDRGFRSLDYWKSVRDL